jgi:capsular exopolysaccharide synthesis family protein
MNDTNEVKLHFLDYWRIIKLRLGLVILTFLLVVVTSGVTIYFMPRQYFSKVAMEVKPDKSGSINVFDDGGRGYADPMFVPTQFQVLRKKEILYPVLDTLKLEEEWSKRDGGRKMQRETAYLTLLGMLDLKEVRNTGLIEIGVYSIDAQEAANIANTVAVIYRETRLSILQQNIDRALSQLRDEVDKQRKLVDDALAGATLVRARDNIIDPDPESFNSTLSTSDRNIVELERQLNEQRLLVTKLKGSFEQIVKMKPEELREVLRTLQIEDQNVIKMVFNLQDATAKEAELYGAGLGENHPRLKSVRSQKEVYLTTLSDALRSVTKNEASRLQIQENVLKELEEKFKGAQEFQIQDKQKMAAYLEAKTKYLQAKKIFEVAQIKLSTEILERGIDFEPAKIWEKAEPSIYHAKPKVKALLALSALVGAVFGVALAFFLEYLDTSVKTLDDIEKHLQIPVLAVVPKGVPELIKADVDVPDSEAYRILRTNIEFNKPNRNANTFTLVSGGPGEGKSTTLNNLAYTCAQGGYNVLIVDADVRRPSQHRFFDMEEKNGLVDYLQGQAEVEDLIRPTKLDNLSFLPSGLLPPDAMNILNTQRMVDLIAKLKKQYDLVFIDSPPILGVSDASVLASECDGTVMVVQHRRFPRAMLQRVKQAVLQSGGSLIGVVLNNVDKRHDDGYSYYNGYSDYYHKPRDKKVAPSPRRVAKPAVEAAATPVSVASQPVAKNGEAKAPQRSRVEHEEY